MSDGSSDVPNGLQGPWTIVGCGRLGRAIGLAGRSEGMTIRTTWNRTCERAEESNELLMPEAARWGELPEALRRSDVEGATVWLTVVDDALAGVAEACAEHLAPAHLVLHCAGSRGAEVLREVGVEAPVGSLHPLLAVTEPTVAAEKFGDVAWSVEGDPRARAFARAFTSAFGAQLVPLSDGARAVYHASAATAANLLVALADAAFEMAGEAGLEREEARDLLVPLMASAVDNLREDSVSEALSGPVARGDEGTVRRHLEALEEREDLRDLYDMLTARARHFADPDE